MKRKSFIILLSIISFLILCITLFSGVYLVNYTLAVDENHYTPSMTEPYTGKQDTVAQKEFDEWYPTQQTSELKITSNDGLSLWAESYPSELENPTVILAIHGYTVDHRQIEPAIKPFVEQGYMVVTPDQRSSGNSEGNIIGMGYLEKDDVLLWINKINEEYNFPTIYLYGESMGAATILQASQLDLPSNVKGIIEDCGYTNAYDMFKFQLKERFGLPPFPFLQSAAFVGQFMAGYNFYNASPIKAIQNTNLPILFIHGAVDTYIPVEMAYELYDSYEGPKELLIVPDADHGDSSDVNPELYYNTIFNFIEAYQ